MIVVISLVLSGILLVVAIVARKRRAHSEGVVNEELESYYSMAGEPIPKQLRQLVLAAKSMLKHAEQLSKDSETISELYDDRVISDGYFKRHKQAEEDLVIEKTIIENEADSLRPGSKDAIFSEAKKLLANESSSTNTVPKVFSEALFLKKQDSLTKDLRSRRIASL